MTVIYVPSEVLDRLPRPRAAHHSQLLGILRPGSRLRVQGSGFRVQGSGCRVLGAGFSAQCSVSSIQGSGFRVQG